MVNVQKLRGLMAEKGLNQREISKQLGIHEMTFGRKMKTGVFNSDEMDALIDILDIKNPVEIFFASFVS